MRRSPFDSGPLATHDHEWRMQEAEPIIEDGAAVFILECNWRQVTGSSTDYSRDETYYSYGAGCEKTRYYRMEPAWVEKKCDDGPNVYYLGSELDHFWRVAERAFISAASDQSEIEAIDPDEELGYVTYESDEWRVKFKANHDPQIDPRPR